MKTLKPWLPWFVLAIVLIVLPLLPWFSREDIRRWLVGAALLAGWAIAFDFSAGYIKVVNFGFAAFAGAGSYSSSLLVIHLGLSPWLGMCGGALIAGILGLLTGVLTLRFRGIYASVASWFFGLAVMGLTTNLQGLTGGSVGLSVPLLFQGTSNLPYYYVAAGMMAVTFVVLRTVVRSPMGLAFRAIGENLDAARASGISPARYRIFNYALACLFAGWLGGFYAHYYGILTPQVMDTSNTVQVLVVTYVGGTQSLLAPALLAFPFTFLTQWLTTSFAQLPGLDPFIYGIVLIVVVVLYPQGLAKLLRVVWAQLGTVSTRAAARQSAAFGAPQLGYSPAAPRGSRDGEAEPIAAEAGDGERS